MADFSINALRVVHEVVRRGSFSAAATELGYTQSAVSRQVALAEAAAGCPLFDRHARGVQATEAGRLVAQHAEAVLAELEAVRQALGDVGTRPSGRLRVGAFSTALARLVPEAIATLAAREPHVEVSLREGTSSALLRRIAAKHIDLAIVTAPACPIAAVDVVDLMDDPLLLAVSPGHRLAGRASVDPTELGGERWIAGSREEGSDLLGPWTDSSWTPTVAYVVRDWTAKLGLVAAGHGVTVVPGIAAAALPNKLAIVRIDHPAATRTIAIAHPAGSGRSAAARAFEEAVRDAAAEIGTEVRRRLSA